MYMISFGVARNRICPTKLAQIAEKKAVEEATLAGQTPTPGTNADTVGPTGEDNAAMTNTAPATSSQPSGIAGTVLIGVSQQARPVLL
jgi:hypothetical protein